MQLNDTKLLNKRIFLYIFIKSTWCKIKTESASSHICRDEEAPLSIYRIESFMITWYKMTHTVGFAHSASRVTRSSLSFFYFLSPAGSSWLYRILLYFSFQSNEQWVGILNWAKTSPTSSLARSVGHFSNSL